MRELDGRIVLTTTDITNFAECAHVAELDLAAARGEIHVDTAPGLMAELLWERGADHEARHLEALRAQSKRVLVLDDRPRTWDDYLAAEARTEAAMREGWDVIAQPVFARDDWTARADFLVRVESPSDLGDHSYEVVDTKSALSVKRGTKLQLCDYSLHVERIQGRAPEHGHVVLGDCSTVTLVISELAEETGFKSVRSQLREAVQRRPVTYPEPVEHCGKCRWDPLCVARRETDDHLSLLPGSRKSQRAKLAAAGITTVAGLAGSEGAVDGINEPSLLRMRSLARLQMLARATGRPQYEVTRADGKGFDRLPEPAPGDLFFDFESDPWWPGGGLEYLLGVAAAEPTGPSFHATWAHDRDAEAELYSGFVDGLAAAWRADPRIHAYHYGDYEMGALKRLESRHGRRGMDLTQLLEAGVFVDLLKIVKEALLTSTPGYSLKDIEKFFMPKRDGDVVDAGASLVAYELALRISDPGERAERLDAIERYNEVDCRTTLALRDWLLRLREEESEASPVPMTG